MNSEGRFVKISTSLLFVLNKGVLSFITLINILLGSPLPIVQFSQLYALGSMITPFVGGAESTMLLRAGYRNSNEARRIFTRVRAKLFIITIVAIVLWSMTSSIFISVVFATSVVLCDTSINLLRSHGDLVCSCAILFVRFAVLLSVPFVVFYAFNPSSPFVSYTIACLFLGVVFIWIASTRYKYLAKIQSEGSQEKSKYGWLLMVSTLNILNANVDRVVYPIVIQQDFVLVYLETRNIIGIAIALYSVLGYYKLDSFMKGAVRVSSLFKVLALILGVGALGVGIFTFAYIYFAKASPYTWIFSLSSFFLVNSLGVLNILFTSILGTKATVKLLLGPLCCLVFHAIMSSLLNLTEWQYLLLVGNIMFYIFCVAILYREVSGRKPLLG